MIGRLLFAGDKPGKDTNFRGITIFNTVRGLLNSLPAGGAGVGASQADSAIDRVTAVALELLKIEFL
jgi:hypothetical protein